MSFTKLLAAPLRLFKKDVITFLIIRRHDLGILEDRLRYTAVKSNASISKLRQKVWYLLDLPDYCEEVIVLKTSDGMEIPLTELRKGNEPQHPYILEVWLPCKQLQSTTTIHHMIMGINDNRSKSLDGDSMSSEITTCVGKHDHSNGKHSNDCSALQQTPSTLTRDLNKHRVSESKRSPCHFMPSECKNSDLSSCISTTSFIFKLQGKKSVDNFTSILLKIQTDLSVLSTKLSNLEHRIIT